MTFKKRWNQIKLNLIKQTHMKLFNNHFDIDIKHFIGKRIAVLGMSGAGKSFTNAVLMEEMTKCGLIQLIIDTEGDYTTLKDWKPGKYSLHKSFIKKKTRKVLKSKIVDGKRKKVETKEEYEVLDKSPIIRACNKLLGVDRSGNKCNQSSVILKLDRYSNDDRLELIYMMLSELWFRVRFLDEKIAITIYIDEAHEKIPQQKASHSELMHLINDISKLGRKKGIGLVISSQRPAEVQKNALTQCNIYFLHRVQHILDVEAYSSLISISDSKRMNVSSIARSVKRFKPGQCYYSFETFDEFDDGVRNCFVRIRESRHITKTPGREALNDW